MARYIDATQLQAKILDASIKNKLSESREVLKIFDKMVQDMPTADVAPKSEVAREIFEEIDILVDDWKHSRIQSIQFIAGLAELKKKYTEGE